MIRGEENINNVAQEQLVVAGAAYSSPTFEQQVRTAFFAGLHYTGILPSNKKEYAIRIGVLIALATVTLVSAIKHDISVVNPTIADTLQSIFSATIVVTSTALAYKSAANLYKLYSNERENARRRGATAAAVQELELVPLVPEMPQPVLVPNTQYTDHNSLDSILTPTEDQQHGH